MKTAVVSEYDTVPEMGVVPCRTVNVAALIVLPSIGVLKVAVMTLTAATLTEPEVLLVLLRGTLPAPLTGDVRITVGEGHTFTIPATSSLQPLIETTNSKAAVNPIEIGTPKNFRIREERAHRLTAVVEFVFGVFIDPSKELTDELNLL
jgi:hypothetical protein